jgi:hypothetical protein
VSGLCGRGRKEEEAEEEEEMKKKSADRLALFADAP